MDPDPDPTPDPTPFFIDFKVAKKYNFSYFFLITCAQAYHLQSKKFNFLQKFCIKILFCRHYFSLLNTFMRNWEGSVPDPDQHLRIRKVQEHADPVPDLDPQHC
jgi:hypothetical protein